MRAGHASRIPPSRQLKTFDDYHTEWMRLTAPPRLVAISPPDGRPASGKGFFVYKPNRPRVVLTDAQKTLRGHHGDSHPAIPLSSPTGLVQFRVIW